MALIRHLEDHLISQIAAGEVVERPASVVKELLENSIDAGASRITVELEAGGKRLIRVVDDGAGMSAEDASLAFDRHATSKISSFDDLQGVATLGFRGEALSSIASVGRIDLSTAVEHGDGQRRVVEGGLIQRSEPVSRKRGTTLEVADLFFNVPARRKFLKRNSTELRRCVEVVQGYCLAQREVRFDLVHEDRILLTARATSADGDGLRARIGQIFGQPFEQRLSPIGPKDLSAGGTVYGFVGDRETTRGRRLFVFVNQRLIRDRALLAIFYRSVRSEWKSDQFPALFLFLDVDPQNVDVNVHPQKAEVRFRDTGFLGGVARALSKTLAETRGEEAAFASLVGMDESPPRLAWEGQVSEAGVVPTRFSYSTKLAEVSYSPAAARPVPLSGRREGTGSLRLLGQYKGTLLLLEGPDGLYLIDQHVAHERILFERFRESLKRSTPSSQSILVPPLLELSRSEAARLLEASSALEEAGFALAELSGGSVAMKAHPAVLDGRQSIDLLMSFLEQAQDAEESTNPSGQMLDALAASLSCRAAVKMHHPLGVEEMEALVSELFEAEQPYACPHGRPIVLRLTDRDLEKRFGRR
jgi:DNA mismatch repair protein MutL